jgi:hypothetical protein
LKISADLKNYKNGKRTFRCNSILILLCFLSQPFFGQQNSILIQSYFKDQLFNPLVTKGNQGSGMLPVFESEYDLNKAIRDSSKQFYILTNILFKKHLFEINGNNYQLSISPIADLSVGEDRKDTSGRKLFQNTRGIYIEGDLTPKFSFSTSIFENQARFSSYETSYYSSVGELYTNQSNGTYSMQNAVVSGAARTKPFKTDGFDYAYATGNICFRPVKSIILSAGNTSHFIGDGYRSLLLSDNSVPAPFFRGLFKISDKIEFNYLRMRLFNLIRRPVSSTVESYYESKAFSVNYVTYKPLKGLALSLFEGIVWSRGDSIVSKRVFPLYYSPVPGTALANLSSREMNYLLGLNASYLIKGKNRVYGQLAYANGHFNNPAVQLGVRMYGIANQRDLMLQLEYNHVPNGIYDNGNPRLNYSHYNLPLAAVKGCGYEEFIVRLNYEYQRFYINEKVVAYQLKNYVPGNWLPIYSSNGSIQGNTTLNQLEAGYRFNRKMNLCLFGSWQFRNDKSIDSPITNLLFIGLRTGITNHYNDF